MDQTADQLAARHRPGRLRHRRRDRGRGDRLLRLHRLRHRGHHRRGDQQPAARRARAASSARWRSSPSSTWRSAWSSPACRTTPTSTPTTPPRWPPPSTPSGMDWMGDLIAVGACIGLIVVVMILMLGQTRVGFAMARDGLLPRGLAKVHPRFGTPYRITAITGVAVAADRRLRRPRHAGQPGQHRHALRVRPGQRRRGRPAPHPPRPAARRSGRPAVDGGRRPRRCCCAST